MKKFWMFAPCLIFAGALSAQDVNHFTFNVGGGFTEPYNQTGQRLDRGWNVDAGVGANFNSWVGAMLEFNYNDLGVNRTTLDSLQFPNGSMRVWSATLNPIVHLTGQKGPIDLYLIGGGGIYHRTIEFTRPTVATISAFDPYFGYFYNVAVPANQVIASNTTYKPGVNGGVGIAFGGFRNAKFYAEARYHRMIISDDRHTEYVPVTFGIRW